MIKQRIQTRRFAEVHQYFKNRGYGFLLDARKKLVFFHISDIVNLKGRTPMKFHQVSYVLGKDGKGRSVAKQIKLLTLEDV